MLVHVFDKHSKYGLNALQIALDKHACQKIYVSMGILIRCTVTK